MSIKEMNNWNHDNAARFSRLVIIAERLADTLAGSPPETVADGEVAPTKPANLLAEAREINSWTGMTLDRLSVALERLGQGLTGSSDAASTIVGDTLSALNGQGPSHKQRI